MTGILVPVCRSVVEGFTVTDDPVKRRAILVDMLSVLFAFLLALVILGLIGKWLWNSVVLELFTIAKPAKSFWQIIGLMIFVSLIRP
jgi:hypothetical protein